MFDTVRGQLGCNPKISKKCYTFRVKEDIFGFEITMNDIELMILVFSSPTTFHLG